METTSHHTGGNYDCSNADADASVDAEVDVKPRAGSWRSDADHDNEDGFDSLWRWSSICLNLWSELLLLTFGLGNLGHVGVNGRFGCRDGLTGWGKQRVS